MSQRQLVALGKRLRRARTDRGFTQAELAARLNVSVPTLRQMEKGAPTVAIGTWAGALAALGRQGELASLLAASTRSSGGLELPARLRDDLALLAGVGASTEDMTAVVETLVAQAAAKRRETLLAREAQERKTDSAKRAIMARIRKNPALIGKARTHLADVPDPWLREQWRKFLELPAEQMQVQMKEFRFMGGAPWHSMVQSSPFSKVAS